MLTPGVVEIMHVNDSDIGLKQISINVRNRANNVKITVTKLLGKPASVVHNISGKVFKHMEINAENLVDENISEAKIQFPVNKSWIIRNNINRATAPVATTTTIPVTTTVPAIPSEVGGIPVWIVGLFIVIVVVAVIAFWIYRNRQETALPPAEKLSY